MVWKAGEVRIGGESPLSIDRAHHGMVSNGARSIFVSGHQGVEREGFSLRNWDEKRARSLSERPYVSRGRHPTVPVQHLLGLAEWTLISGHGLAYISDLLE